MSSTLQCVLLFSSLCLADASVGSGADSKANSTIHPSLRTTSDKKFNKDYTGDQRPKVDVFHFHHPYPAVQDSGDFDRDFVKDENSDDGSWKAQSEYDRLRHKLAKEKAEVAKALAAKTKAENELHDAMKREKDQVERKKKVEEEEQTKKKKQGSVHGSSGQKADSEEEHEAGRKYIVPGAKTPGGVTTPGERKNQAVSDLGKEMDALEKCKKQLAEAREKLKKLMAELEAAKKEQEKTEAALDAEMDAHDKAQSANNAAQAHTKKEYQEYLDAKEAYEKQTRKVTQMEADLKAAADKVRAFRDAEDKDGGVYPTPEKRNGAASRSLTFVTVSLCSVMLSRAA